MSETNIIPPPLSTMFRPLSVRPSTPIRIIFPDVSSDRMNQQNYMCFIPMSGLPGRQDSKK
ncbi:hypothetical protein HKD37_16G046009 [Glycine soja]